MRKVYSFASSFFRFLMTVIWNYEVVNHSGLKNAKSCIIASNHSSYFDPPFIGAITPFEITYLAKSELFKYKFFAKFLRMGNAIPVRRGQADLSAISKVLNILDSGKSLLVFPEGGTNTKTIKAGVGLFAIRMKKDIVPIHIKNIDKPISCIFRRKKLIIIVGEPIKYESFSDLSPSKENYQSLANMVYKRIQELGH